MDLTTRAKTCPSCSCARPRRSQLSCLSIVPECRCRCRCQGARANYYADLRRVDPDGNWSRTSIGERLGCGFWQDPIVFLEHEGCFAHGATRQSFVGILSASRNPIPQNQRRTLQVTAAGPSSDALHRPVMLAALRAWCGHRSSLISVCSLQVGTRNKW